jgi:hypothetical protein
MIPGVIVEDCIWIQETPRSRRESCI